jgi:threonine synthase
MCPHTAVAYLGLTRYLADHPSEDLTGIFLSTAHPCKFPEVYGEEEKRLLVYPPQVARLEDEPKNTLRMEVSFDRLREVLLARETH